MYKVFARKYLTAILASMFFFYLGCVVTIINVGMGCTDSHSKIKTAGLKTDVEYVVLVISAPDNEDKRDAIRATWAQFSSNIFKENGETLYKWNHTREGQQKHQEFISIYFAMGTKSLTGSAMNKLKNEDRRSRDLLLLDDFQDTYTNLTYKLLRSLKWISENVKGYKYLIKCDDDSFVRVDLIARDLATFAPEMSAPEISEYVSFKKVLPSYKGLYWGYFNGRARVYLSGKWKEKDWFLCDNYLPYALGGGYVISRSIVDYISENADFLSHYNSEDVSMGVWTAPLDKINRVHDVRFDTEWKSRGCSKHMLVRHKQAPGDMFQLYKTLVHSHGNILCRTESTERKSYIYNWNVLPSMCCK